MIILYERRSIAMGLQWNLSGSHDRGCAENATAAGGNDAI